MPPYRAGRRNTYSAYYGQSVTTPERAAKIFQALIESERRKFKDPYLQEHSMVLMVSVRGKMLGAMMAASGSHKSVHASPRSVFYNTICNYAAKGVILGHNHPSGDPRPSPADIASTKRMIQAGRILGLPVLDHIIITERGYFSFKSHGLMTLRKRRTKPKFPARPRKP